MFNMMNILFVVCAWRINSAKVCPVVCIAACCSTMQVKILRESLQKQNKQSKQNTQGKNTLHTTTKTAILGNACQNAFWSLLKLLSGYWGHTRISHASGTAQGGGGSFKNRKPVGEVGCCESRMAEPIPKGGWGLLPFCLFLWLPTCLSTYLSIYVFIYLSMCLSICRSIYRSMCLSIYRSIYRSIDLSIYQSIYLLSVGIPFYVKFFLLIHFLSLYCHSVGEGNKSRGHRTDKIFLQVKDDILSHDMLSFLIGLNFTLFSIMFM